MYQRRNLRKQEDEQFERNKLKILVFLLFFLFSSGLSRAQHYFELDTTLTEFRDLNYNLQLVSAKDSLVDYISTGPKNSAAIYLLHFNAFLKAFISEENKDYAYYRQIKDKALRHFEYLPDTTPYKRFLLSEVYFHSATIKAKHSELYSAALDISRVIRLVEENASIYPSFLPNNKSRGLLKVYLSTVPQNYAWATRLLGIKGDLNEGLRLLNELSDYQDSTREFDGIAKEAAYLHAFSLHQVAKKPRQAWVEIFKCTKDYQSNKLSAFFRANMALKLNKTKTAISVLQGIEQDEDECVFLFLDYMQGVALLNQQNKDAIVYLQEYVNKYNGRSFKQSCFQKISWYYILQGDVEKAKRAQEAILNLPESMMEVDKQAIQYAKKSLPLKSLLEVRLLCDNGDYSDAMSILKKLDHKKLPDIDSKIEYSYRFGQVSEKLGNMEAAIKFYEACTILSKESEEYYGAYASIYLGDYYLSLKQKAAAIKYYNKALSFDKNKEYKESIEHRATAGLKRARLLK